MSVQISVSHSTGLLIIFIKSSVGITQCLWIYCKIIIVWGNSETAEWMAEIILMDKKNGKMKKGVVEVETTDYLAPCSSVRTISLLPHQSTNYINFLVYIFIYLLVSSYCFVYGMHIWWIHFYHMFASSIAMVTAAQNRHSSSSSSNDNSINKWTTEIVLVMLQSWLNYNNIMDTLCPGITNSHTANFIAIKPVSKNEISATG